MNKMHNKFFIGHGQCFNFFIALLFSVSITAPDMVFAKNPDNRSSLSAFSLKRAKELITSGNAEKNVIKQIGYITRIWAVVIDDKNDIIIVGERDPSLYPMILDDVAVAIRTRNKVSSKENPGVSIEPASIGQYSPVQNVKYYGGIEKTNYGKICFETDLLLKHLTLGYITSGIDGLPTEWDLDLDNAKAGRKLEFWENSIGRSWFFPHRILINKKNHCATVTSIKMEVRSSSDIDLEISEKYFDINSNSISIILNDFPSAVSAINARLLTQKYDEISVNYPVLVQLENLLALSGLFAEALGDIDEDLYDYWLTQYSVTKVDTPEKIPTLNRGEKGLAYTCLTSGGVFGIYEVKDGWTHAVLTRNPRYLKQAVLLSRPTENSLSWVIPLELGAPKNWSDNLLKKAQNIKPIMAEKKVDPYLMHTNKSFKPLVTPGWHPATEGNNLLSFSGNFYFSTSGFDAHLPDVKFTAGQTEINFGLLPNMKWVYKNRFELKITAPLILKIQEWDEPPEVNLPGLDSTPVYAFAGGIENLIITNRIQLFDGLINHRRALPSVVFGTSVFAPTSCKLFDGYITKPRVENEDVFSMEFGTEKWNGFHEIQVEYPLGHLLQIGVSGKYYTEWNKSKAGNRLSYDTYIHGITSKESGFGIGLHYKKSLIYQEYDTNGLQLLENNGWISEGHQILLSFSTITSHGVNMFMFGVLFPGKSYPELGNSFIMSIDLSGSTLWDWRTWL